MLCYKFIYIATFKHTAQGRIFKKLKNGIVQSITRGLPTLLLQQNLIKDLEANVFSIWTLEYLATMCLTDRKCVSVFILSFRLLREAFSVWAKVMIRCTRFFIIRYLWPSIETFRANLRYVCR